MPKANTTAVSPYDQTKIFAEKLEEGIKDLFTSDKYKAYLETMSHFHNYSSRNIMLIKLQMPHATQIASYNNWKEKFNRQVKKGEKGIKIFAPIGSKKAETIWVEKLDEETGAPLLDKNGKVIMVELSTPDTLFPTMRFKLVSVFDISQTHGEPLAELVEDLTGNVAHYEAFLDALKEVSPLPIEFEPMPPNQDGYCRFGVKIAVREGMSEVQTVAAIVHEITHARLHDRNAAAETPESKPKSKEVKEIEAESVSYVVCQKYNIDTGANSFGYLAEWGSHDMREIKASLETIRKEASELISAIDEKFAAICAERGIDLTIPEQPEQPEQTAQLENAEKPPEPEPTFTTESTTENILGVDFSFEEIKPIIPEKEQASEKAIPLTAEQKNFEKLAELFPDIASNEFLYQRMEAGTAFMPLSLEWTGDNQLSIMHTYVQDGDLMYDPMIVMEVDHESKTANAVEFQQSAPPLYQRIEDGIGHSIDGNGNERTINNLQGQLNDFAAQWFENIDNQSYLPVQAVLRDAEYADPSVYFNSEQKPFSLAFKYSTEGTTISNFMDKDDNGKLAKVAYVDSFRNVEFYEDNLPKDVVMIVENVKLTNEKTAQEKQAAAEPMPDQTITPADRDEYGYTAEDILPLNRDRAADLFAQDHTIYLLFNDNTAEMAFDSSDIVGHKGIFGIEREDWQKSQEYRDIGNSTAGRSRLGSGFFKCRARCFCHLSNNGRCRAVKGLPF